MLSWYCHLIYNTLNKRHPSIKMLNKVFLPFAIPTVTAATIVVVIEILPGNVMMIMHTASTIPNVNFYHRKAAFELPYSFWSIKSFCLQPSNISPLSGQGQMLETSFLSFCSIFCFYRTKQKENSGIRGKESFKFMQVIREQAYLQNCFAKQTNKE